MRLINARTLELRDFTLSRIPPYAILSHTWGDEEVAFQDMASPDRSVKKGFAKITQTCNLALKQGLEFAWVDTCCIDKSSSAELTESINSMFQWYKNAVVCYVFLEDLLEDIPAEDGLAHCRWFTRGWTLQELLAPKMVEFYDMVWNYRGSKFDFCQSISKNLRIPSKFLLGYKVLTDYSIATRMSWAAHRQTTRVEDMAYCLLGIFDVNMPLIYGEGLKAFRRLQEEIVKRSNDLTIFAWDDPESHKHLDLFATSPAAFAGSSGISSFGDDFPDFSVTNKGLLLSGEASLRAATLTGDGDDRGSEIYALFLGYLKGKQGGIYLRKVAPALFYRDGRYSLAGFGMHEVKETGILDDSRYYILIHPITSDLIKSSDRFRDRAIHVPVSDIYTLDEAVPEDSWDVTDRVFLRPRSRQYLWSKCSTVLALELWATILGRVVRLVVLCDYRNQIPLCKIFMHDEYSSQATMIFDDKNRRESIYWTDLELQAPELSKLGHVVQTKVGKDVFSISASLDKGIVESISKEVKLYSLNFDITQRVIGDKGKTSWKTYIPTST